MKVYVYIGIYIHLDKEDEIRVFSKKEDAEKFILDNVNAVTEKASSDHYTDVDEAIWNWNEIWCEGRSYDPEDEYYTDYISPLADKINLVECELE